MAELTTEHAGYAIRYSENEDVWRCHDLDVEDTKLSRLRQKINRVLADARKVNPVEAYHVGNWGQVERVQVQSLDRTGLKAWVARREGRSVHRRCLNLSSLAEISPEVEAAIARMLEAIAAEQNASRAMKTAIEAVPRLTADRLRQLGVNQGGDDGEA